MLRIMLFGVCLCAATAALAQDKVTIAKLNDAWTAAFNKGDAQAVSAMYAEDADLLSPGSNAAREIGKVSLKTKSQPPQQIVGKYAVVWRKIGGQWKLATEIW